MSFATTTKCSQARPGVIDYTVTFTGVTATDVSDALIFDGCDTITIHAELTGTAGTTTLTCSNDGLTYYAVPTTAISITGDSVKVVDARDLGFSFYKLSISGHGADTAHVYRVVGVRNRFVRP
jgi:hypothetical protein